MRKFFLLGLTLIVQYNATAQSSLKLIVPIGHTRPITALAISPDEQFIFSGAADNIIHLWGVNDGRLLKTFRGHDNPISTLIVSSSGKYLLSLDSDRKGLIREISTGAVQDSIENHIEYYVDYGDPDYNSNEVFFSKETDGFGWIDTDNKLHFWSPGNRKVISPDKSFLKVALSPNGKYMLAIGAITSGYYVDPIQNAYLINLPTGTLRLLGKVNIAEGKQLGFSPDNSMAFVGDDGNSVFAYSTQTGLEVKRSRQSIWLTEFEIGATGLLKLNCYDGSRLWDPARGTIRPFEEKDWALFKKNEQSLVSLGAVFTKEGVDSLKQVNLSMAYQCKPIPWDEKLFHLPVALWRTNKDQVESFTRISKLAYFKPGASKPILLSAAIAIKFKDKNWVARSHDRSILLTDLDTNKDLKELHGLEMYPPGNVSFSPDGRSLTYQDRNTRLWNFNQSKMLTLPGEYAFSLRFVQPPNASPLLLAGRYGKVDIHSAENGSLIHSILSSDGHEFGEVKNLQVSNDYKFLVWSDFGQSYLKKMNWESPDWYSQFRSLNSKVTVRYSKSENSQTENFTAEPTILPFFIPNRSELFSAFDMAWYSTVVYLNWQRLEDRLVNVEPTLPYVYGSSQPSSFSFSAVPTAHVSNDGNRILFLSPIVKYDRPATDISWVDLQSIGADDQYMYNMNWMRANLKATGPSYYPGNMTADIHPVEPWFALAGPYQNDISATALSEKSAFKPFAFVGHTDGITSVDFSADGKFLASASLDNTIKIWNTETKQEVVTLVTLGENDWLVSHPSGLFDASAGAMNFIYFSTGQETISLEQIKDRFYEPNLLKKVLAGESLRAVSGLEKIDLYPSIRSTLDTLNAKLIISVTDQGGGIGKTSVFLNAKEVVEDLRVHAPSGSKGAFTITLDLSDFKNLVWGDMNFLGVKAYNGSGYISSPVQKIYYKAPGKQEHLKAYEPTLHCLVVGVSDYQNDELDLKYSAKDAQDFAQALSTAGKRLFGNRANVTLLTSDAKDETLKPTKANVNRVMKEIGAKAQIDDLIIMYFSGHGTNLSGDDADFLYLTADARGFTFIDPAIRQSSTISSSELTEFMKGIAAQKQVLIFDACASGRMVENMLAKRDVPSSTLRAMERMKDRTGTYILTGCAADAVSYEASQFGQGLLTYSLLSGMKGAALRDNKFVDVLKLFQYAKEEVPKLAEHVGGIQEPKVFSPYGGESFDIGFLEDTDKKMIPLTEAKPFLVRSSFQNELKLRDDLGLSKLVDQAIAEQAVSGKNASYIFVDSQEFPGAIYISGRYKIENGNAVLKVVLFKDDKLLGSLDKTLNTSDPAKVQTAVLEFVQATVVKK